jgi:hypothetical protein
MNYKPYICAASCLLMLWCGYDAGKASGKQSMQAEVNAAKLEVENMKRRAQEMADNHAKQMSAASKMYQEARAEAEAKQKERIVKVREIVEKPVYRSDCIDKSGLDEINKVIGGRK